MDPLSIAGIIGATAGALPSVIKGGTQLYDWLSGSGKQQGQQQGGYRTLPNGTRMGTFNAQSPQQQDLQSQLISMAQAQLSGPNSIENEARRGHKERGLPALLERFAAKGSGFNSSAFQNALLNSQQGLESNIAAQKFGMLQNLLGPALSGGNQPFTVGPDQNSNLMEGMLGASGNVNNILSDLYSSGALGGLLGGGNQSDAQYSRQAQGFSGGDGELPSFQPQSFQSNLGSALGGGMNSSPFFAQQQQQSGDYMNLIRQQLMQLIGDNSNSNNLANSSSANYLRNL